MTRKRAPSLFGMIRSTHANNPDGCAQRLHRQRGRHGGRGGATRIVAANPTTGEYRRVVKSPVHTLMKVETHNHPTAIAPFPARRPAAAARFATRAPPGCGARPKAGLTGFSVSHLRPARQMRQPWENGRSASPPHRIGAPRSCSKGRSAAHLSTMSSAARTYSRLLSDFRKHRRTRADRSLGISQADHDRRRCRQHSRGRRPQGLEVPAGALLVVLGGPAMLIGLGGGAASSMGSGTSTEDLDFASVQRGNPEMQRRAQQVIDACWSAGMTGGENPLVIIHDVGAGGLSNALPEVMSIIVRAARKSDLRKVPNAEPGMSPLEIWCNEAQERYVLAIMPASLEWFEATCRRERCPYAVLGELDDDSVICALSIRCSAIRRSTCHSIFCSVSRRRL